MLLMLGLTFRVRQWTHKYRFLFVSWSILLGVLFAGLYSVDHVTNVAKSGLQNNLSGLAKSFAIALHDAGHENITLETSPDDPLYLKLIEMMSSWQEVIPVAASIYTFRKNEEGEIVFICCPPADINRDGVIQGERELLVPIGTVYEEAEEDIQEILDAFEGKSGFNGTPVKDEWGLWITAAEPIFDETGNRVDAVLGVDFWGEEWNSYISHAIFWPQLLFLSIVILYFAVQLFIIRQQNTEDRLTEYAASLEQTMEELVIAKREADIAAQAKSYFLANVSHEIRTPLNAILGSADLLINVVTGKSTEANLEQLVDMMRKSSNNLMTLIDDVLLFSNIDMNRLTLESVPVIFRQLVEDVKTMVSIDLAKKPDVEFHVEWGNSVPEIILGDPVRLRQILLCLVNNAIKFTQSGHITVRCLLAPPPRKTDQTAASHFESSYLIPLDSNIARAKGLRGTVQIDGLSEQMMLGSLPTLSKIRENNSESSILQIDVSDTGIGIDQQQFDTLFKPFTQVDGTSTREFGGTGLGLSIVKGLVQLMGGTVKVVSKPGRGSLFSVLIPVRECRDANMATPPPLLRTHQKAESESLPLRGYNILVVDDVSVNRLVVETKLRDMGANVQRASNGQIAVDMVLNAEDSEMPFDLIFMDLQMPIMDGFDATSTLRRRGYTKPIVALTANRDSREQATESGCNSVLFKPAEGEVLLKTITELVKR